MNAKRHKNKLTGAESALLCLTLLFLGAGLLFFGWYGSTYIPVRQSSEVHPGNLTIRSGNSQCTLEIPGGTLNVQRIRRAAVGANYQMSAEVDLEKPLRFVDCTGGVPNWSINVEAQTTLAGSQVKPFAAIRQPAFGRDNFSFRWQFTPEEAIPQYRSYLWLRVIVNEQDQTIENWNVLVRDFPMENVALFGQPVVIWIINAGFSLVLGLLLGVIFLQKRRLNIRK